MKKKTANVLLKDKGDYIKYLGLNIVKCEKSNRITVGKNIKMILLRIIWNTLLWRTVKKSFILERK